MEGREGVNFWSNLCYVIYEWPLKIQKRLKKIHLVLTIFGKKSVVGCGSHGKQMWRKSAKDSALISRWIKKVELFIFYYLLFFFIEKSSLLKNSAFADKLTHFLPLSGFFYIFFTTSLYWIEDDQLPTVLAPRPACVPRCPSLLGYQTCTLCTMIVNISYLKCTMSESIISQYYKKCLIQHTYYISQ